jgi:hypothetical protein
MTAFQKGGVIARITFIDTYDFVPAIGDARQAGVKFVSQTGNRSREGVREIFVFPASEAVSGHDDAAAKMLEAWRSRA